MEEDKFGFIGPRTKTQLRKDIPDCYYLTIKGSVHILGRAHLLDLIDLIKEVEKGMMECECGTMMTIEDIERYHPGCMDEWQDQLELSDND